MTALSALAEQYNYSSLFDKLIRDRLILALADRQLSERMELDLELTMEKAIAMVKRQQAAL